MIERVLTGCANEALGEVAPLLTLLRRFATEAAREEARLFCDELVAEDFDEERNRRRVAAVIPGAAAADSISSIVRLGVRPQYPNCSRRMRSSRLWPGSNSMCMAIAVVHADLDRADRAHLVVVGDGGDRPLVGFEHLDGHARAVGQQRAAPAPRPERADRRERQKRRIDRDDRPLHRKIVGGRARRRRQQDAVGDELGEALLAVDQDAQPRRLVGSGGTARPR